MPRPTPLRRTTLARLDRRVSVPRYDSRALRTGVVHFGVGRFHKAHQARYFDDLAERGVSTQWGVVGAGLRSRRTRDVLAAQDHLFTVVESGSDGMRARVVGSMQHYLYEPQDRTALLHLLARPDLPLVTLTVTPEAYAVDGPLAGVGDHSVFTLLAEALGERRRLGSPPFTVLSCDNIPDNGAAARRALLAAADRLPGQHGLSSWVTRNVAFPTSVVDRITPPVADTQPRLLAERFGLVDASAVVAEEYSQWVVQDTFSSERPPLDEVGVRFVTDVAPFAEAKMRLLNGAHCAVGYVGAAAGHPTSAAAMADPAVAGFVGELLTFEVAPTVTRPPGVDLDDYVTTVLRRIADPHLADPLYRLCRRGSVRLPMYVAPSLRAALRSGGLT